MELSTVDKILHCLFIVHINSHNSVHNLQVNAQLHENDLRLDNNVEGNSVMYVFVVSRLTKGYTPPAFPPAMLN